MDNNSNLGSINQEEAFNLCRLYTNIGQNILLLGRRGTGKTHIAMQAVLENGFKINYLNLSTLDRCDLIGFPNIYSKDDIINYKSPYYLPTLKPNQKVDTVLLLDEIDKADPSIFGPLLEILQFKTINGKKLNVLSCIMTGNMMQEGSYSNQISTAILDRAAKYVLQFDPHKWLSWARSHQINDLLLGFLEQHQDLICGPIEASTLLATPSPRGWSLASQSIDQANQYKINDTDTITHIIAGFVGSSAALQFLTWFEFYRHFEAEVKSIIEQGNCIQNYQQLNPTEQLVFCITLCYLGKLKILDTNTHKKRLKVLGNICRYFMEQQVAKEIQLMAVKNSFNIDMIAKYKLFEDQSFFKLIGELQDSSKIK